MPPQTACRADRAPRQEVSHQPGFRGGRPSRPLRGKQARDVRALSADVLCRGLAAGARRGGGAAHAAGDRARARSAFQKLDSAPGGNRRYRVPCASLYCESRKPRSPHRERERGKGSPQGLFPRAIFVRSGQADRGVGGGGRPTAPQCRPAPAICSTSGCSSREVPRLRPRPRPIEVRGKAVGSRS